MDFCIRLLKFNIYNKTSYMHRKNNKFRKISLIAPTCENKVLSSLNIPSASLLNEERACAKVQYCTHLFLALHGMAFIDLLYRFIKKALRILYAINRGQYGLISRK